MKNNTPKQLGPLLGATEGAHPRHTPMRLVHAIRAYDQYCPFAMVERQDWRGSPLLLLHLPTDVDIGIMLRQLLDNLQSLVNANFLLHACLQFEAGIAVNKIGAEPECKRSEPLEFVTKTMDAASWFDCQAFVHEEFIVQTRYVTRREKSSSQSARCHQENTR